MSDKFLYIAAVRVCKNFKQGAMSVPVLVDVDVTFKKGHTYAITGHSGSGKSTLMHILAGFDDPDSGHVMFNGQQVQHFSPHERESFFNRDIGFLFQLPYLIDTLSVLENVMLKGLVIGIPVSECVTQALDLLTRVGLAHKAYEQPASLSGGEQQRVALARALFNRPAFLFADEPTGSLDEKTGKMIIELLLEYQRMWGMGLIMSSHDRAVAHVAHELFHLRAGLLEKQKDARGIA